MQALVNDILDCILIESYKCGGGEGDGGHSTTLCPCGAEVVFFLLRITEYDFQEELYLPLDVI